MLKKLFYYNRKYGLLHATLSYIGRNSLFFWRLIGSVITNKYRLNWLQKHPANRILNLGGGGNCLSECLTADISPRADIYADLEKKLPFDDASFDAIFCEEAIEHIELDAATKLLKECWRILKPGGFLRITTPDLDWFMHQAVDSVQACNEINGVFYSHGHRYLYTRQALQFYCKDAGFINLKISTYKDPKSKLGYLDSHADRFNHLPEISQYLEIQKPDF